jgi:hypothetical protein
MSQVGDDQTDEDRTQIVRWATPHHSKRVEFLQRAPLARRQCSSVGNAWGNIGAVDW